MRAIVIGAGSMGSVFGAGMARAGAEVTLYDSDAGQAAALRDTGLTVTGPAGAVTLRLPVVEDTAGLSGYDCALVMVDSNATAEVAPLLPPLLAPAGVALTLQNGIGNVEALAAVLGVERVLGGATYVSAAMRAPGHAHNTNIGPTVLGEAAGGLTPRATMIAALLQRAGFPTAASDNVMGHIWSKFALNCALNPLAAITGLRTGEIARHAGMSALLDAVIAEILAVVAAKGIRLPEEDAAAHIREHAWLRYNRPSMLQHVEAGRPTEIGALNGALVRAADALGVAVPVNRTIAALVRGIEARQVRGAALDEAACEAAARAEPMPHLTA